MPCHSRHRTQEHDIHQLKKHSKKLLVATCGGFILLAGIIMIPYPGPGWLVVFAGLGILSTEFTWARRLLDYGKAKYSVWQMWLARQPLWCRLLVWSLTAIIVVVTVWLLDGYGFIEHLLHLHQAWLDSPIFH